MIVRKGSRRCSRCGKTGTEHDFVRKFKGTPSVCMACNKADILRQIDAAIQIAKRRVRR